MARRAADSAEKGGRKRRVTLRDLNSADRVSAWASIVYLALFFGFAVAILITVIWRVVR